MYQRRTVVAGLCVLAATSLALTACQSTGTTSPSSSSPAGTPQSGTAALATAVGKLKGAAYDVTVTVGGGQIHGTGSVDPSSGSATIEEKGTVQGADVDIIATQVGANLWAKVNLGSALNSQLGVDSSKWMLIDQSKLTGPNSLPFDLSGPDAFDVTGLLTSVNNVASTDATHLAGMVDLTKATGINAPAASDLASESPAAAATPFTAILDDQGRLADLKIDADAFDKSLSDEVAFANYGSPTAITAPQPSEVVPAPDSVYQIFNS